MDSIGYLYVPKACADNNCKNVLITSEIKIQLILKFIIKVCKLHIALHGCGQGRHRIGNEYARYAGYNEVADLNNIIILYPQADSSLLSNPNGCWDWW